MKSFLGSTDASMACFSAGTASFSNNHSLLATIFPSSTAKRPMPGLVPAKKPLLVFSCDWRDAYGSLVLKASSLLGPPTRFEASKLKVIFKGEEMEKKPLSTIPRAYTLSHCDFTANLTLAVSDSITNDMLREWQTTLRRDDVVAEWKKVKEQMSLHVHCYVSSGRANPFQEIAAEFRYHIFCKELPLVLKAVVYGDSALFSEYPVLMEALVWVHFHSKSIKYNRVECWGPLEDVAQRTLDQTNGLDGYQNSVLMENIGKWGSPGTILHAFFAFLL